MEEAQKTPLPDQNPQNTEAVKKVIKPNRITKYIAPIGVVAITIVLAGALVLNKDEIKKSATTAGVQNTQQVAGADANTTAGTANPSVNIKDVNIEGLPFLGDANAKVVIAYWSDYQCPYCKQFELTTMPTVIKNYVDSGKAKIVFKDFQFLGNDSLTGALYARAVWDLYPDKFFTWREALVNKQDGENSGFGDETSVKAMTATVSGIDADKVSTQVASKKADYQAKITADRTEGAKLGVNGTPGFITGTQLISGAADVSKFAAAIDPLLK